jgi:hypothetical protein
VECGQAGRCDCIPNLTMAQLNSQKAGSIQAGADAPLGDAMDGQPTCQLAALKHLPLLEAQLHR